mgnify:CR=1 FL=1
MISVRLSELQNKDVVDIMTGEKIGNISDVEISNDTGNVLKMIVYEKKGLINMLRGGEEVTITWSQIKKIGTDVILVSRNL